MDESVAVLMLSDGCKLSPVQVGKVGRKLSFRTANRMLSEEFRAMKGGEWRADLGVWTATDCRRNWIQLESITGEKGPDGKYQFRVPKEFKRYTEFQQGQRSSYTPRRPKVRAHQKQMVEFASYVRGCEWAAEQGTGKTLAAGELLEWAAEEGFTDWWYVSLLRPLEATKLEFIKWNISVSPRFLNYDILARELEACFQCRSCGLPTNESKTRKVCIDSEGATYEMAECRGCGAQTEKHASLWRKLPQQKAPHGVIFDESSALKNSGAKRTEAAQLLADAVRAEHDGFVIDMSGSPAPKDPTDWHSQVENFAPGWLRESSKNDLTNRLAVIDRSEGFPRVAGWKKDEVEKLYLRLKPVVQIHHARDCIELPKLSKELIHLEPSPEILRAAKLIAETSANAVSALNRMRQLSDGFQYGGVSECSDCHGHGSLPDTEVECQSCGGIGFSKQEGVKRSPCPKDERLRLDLGQNEELGRVVVYAGYHESVDRACDVAEDEGWTVARLDGRGWMTQGRWPSSKQVNPQNILLEMDEDTRSSELERLCFIAHPGSGGYGLNLTAACENIFYSNDFNAASRWQAEKRSHRNGQRRNVCIKDYVHLPTDEFVIKNLENKRMLQSVTLGEVVEWLL
jgi:hypothetical protein